MSIVVETDPTTSAPPAHQGGPSPSAARRFLVVGGVSSTLMGAAHFVLPVMYPWEQHVEGLYEPVAWALFATTVFFGLLLVLGGLVTVAVARASNTPRRIVVWVAGGMALFWIAAAGYEVVVPFPEGAASWILPAFSLLVAALHILGLWLGWARPITGQSPIRAPSPPVSDGEPVPSAVRR